MDNIGSKIGTFIGFILLIVFVISVNKGCARMANGMVHISDNYSYDKETHVIYIESVNPFGEFDMNFKPYYDEDGKTYKYNPDTEEWIMIE